MLPEMDSVTLDAMADELKKLAMGPVMKKFIEGAKGEAGPALGATIGAGLASATGGNPLSGAALGYGAGSLPEMILSHRAKAHVG
jgi:hypothetical protein